MHVKVSIQTTTNTPFLQRRVLHLLHRLLNCILCNVQTPFAAHLQ
jgi:hypothetical protein